MLSNKEIGGQNDRCHWESQDDAEGPSLKGDSGRFNKILVDFDGPQGGQDDEEQIGDRKSSCPKGAGGNKQGEAGADREDGGDQEKGEEGSLLREEHWFGPGWAVVSPLK